MSLAESTVKLGQRIHLDDSPALFYYECGGAVTYACAACNEHVTTGINEDFLEKRLPFSEKHKECTPPWANECEFCGEPATHTEFFDRDVPVCDACHA